MKPQKHKNHMLIDFSTIGFRHLFFAMQWLKESMSMWFLCFWDFITVHIGMVLDIFFPKFWYICGSWWLFVAGDCTFHITYTLEQGAFQEYSTWMTSWRSCHKIGFQNLGIAKRFFCGFDAVHRVLPRVITQPKFDHHQQLVNIYPKSNHSLLKMVIYALFTLKCRESHLRAFVVKSTRVPGLG